MFNWASSFLQWKSTFYLAWRWQIWIRIRHFWFPSCLTNFSFSYLVNDNKNDKISKYVPHWWDQQAEQQTCALQLNTLNIVVTIIYIPLLMISLLGVLLFWADWLQTWASRDTSFINVFWQLGQLNRCCFLGGILRLAKEFGINGISPPLEPKRAIINHNKSCHNYCST